MVVSAAELWGVLVLLSAYMPCLERECQLGPVAGPMQNLQQVDLLWSTGEWSAAVEQALVELWELFRPSRHPGRGRWARLLHSAQHHSHLNH